MFFINIRFARNFFIIVCIQLKTFIDIKKKELIGSGLITPALENDLHVFVLGISLIMTDNPISIFMGTGMIIASNHDNRILTFFTPVQGPDYKPFQLIIYDLLKSSNNYASLYTQKQFQNLMSQSKISNMANMVDSVFNFTSKALDKMFSLPLIKRR